MIIDGRILTSLLMLTLFALATFFALFLPQKAAFVPLIVAVPGMLLSATQLFLDVRDIRNAASPERSGGQEDGVARSVEDGDAIDEIHEDARSEFEMFFWLGGYLLFLLCFGFIVGGTIMNFLYVRFNSKESWRTAIIAAISTVVVLYGIFIWLLELSLFNGLILEKFL